MPVLRRAAAALTLIATLGAPAAAQDLPEEPGAARIVRLFDLFCFALVPDIAKIGEIADQHFEEITGEELERYRQSASADEVRAWRFTDFDADYVLTTARAPASERFAAEVPELADATSYACSIVLPPAHPQDDIRAELAGLMGRPPDRGWETGPLSASLWVGETPNMVVNVLYYGPADGSPGGLLSSVAFVTP